MTVIDPSTSVGKIRLRTGDWSDLPILPDTVIESAIDDCGGNLPRAARLCAQYILATLSFKTHKKIAQLEIWSGEQFRNYVQFLNMTVLNPNFADIAPIPYGASGTELHPLIQFQQDWDKQYSATQSQQLAFDASMSANDGSRFGILGGS